MEGLYKGCIRATQGLCKGYKEAHLQKVRHGGCEIVHTQGAVVVATHHRYGGKTGHDAAAAGACFFAEHGRATAAASRTRRRAGVLAAWGSRAAPFGQDGLGFVGLSAGEGGC